MTPALPRLFALLCLAGLAAAGPLSVRPLCAQESRPAKETPKAAKARATADQQEQALAFAREHHPELADLLEALRENSPKDYQAAMADLRRGSERINRWADSNPDRHRAELADWKLSSRIRLLAARLAMDPSDELRDEIRALLKERHAERVAALKVEREKANRRLEKLDGQIAGLEKDRDGQLRREFEQLESSTRASARRRDARPEKNTEKNTEKNAEKSPAKKPEKNAETSPGKAADKGDPKPGKSDKKNDAEAGDEPAKPKPTKS